MTINNDYAIPLKDDVTMKYTIIWIIKDGVTNGIVEWHEYQMTFNAETATRRECLLSLSRWIHQNQHRICTWAVSTDGWFKTHLEEFIKSSSPRL